MQGKYLHEVREQYELYPYPHRNPEDERKRLLATQMDYLDQLNHFCFGGTRDFSTDFRTLIAGGGTGDSAIFLAEQLRGTKAEIVYLDISQASMAIAKARAQARKLTNIRFQHGSLLDVAKLGLGHFDYINCSGVLHHLEHPDAGLTALSSVLAEDGAMGIMLYAKYGRTAVYQLQDLMRLINQQEPQMQARVSNCRSALGALSKNHWARLSHTLRPDDVTKLTDSGLYDLLLHSTDRAYTIPELYAFVGSAGLTVNHLIGREDIFGNRVYDPGSYIKDPILLAKVRKLDPVTQKAIAELLNGHVRKHIVYLQKQVTQAPTLENLDLIPALSIGMGADMYKAIYHAAHGQDKMVTVQQPGKGVQFPKSVHTELLLKYLDGKRSLKQLFSAVCTAKGLAASENTFELLRKEFQIIYDALQIHYWMFLRAPSIPAPRTVPEMNDTSL